LSWQKELKELLIFRQYQVDVENIKCHFQWWEKYDIMFFVIEFLACQILEMLAYRLRLRDFVLSN
jgi:hypothetical protein